jgi:segregation and condensation protein B
VTESPRKIVEALLLVAEEPLPLGVFCEVLEKSRAEVEGCLRELQADYEGHDRGFVLREVAGGWRLYTSPQCAPWLERFASRGARARLSGAALEVLAIVAYRGPIARAQINELRGVDSDGVVKTLEARGLIEEVAASGGGPSRYATSTAFLEGIGLRSLDDLPPLVEFMPDAEAVEAMEAKLSPNA